MARPGAPSRHIQGGTFGVVSLVLVFLTVVLLTYVVGSMFWSAFGMSTGSPDLGVLSRTFSRPEAWTAMANTAKLLLASASIAVVVATAFAWLNERTDARLGQLSQVLPILPMFIPPVATTIGWVFLAEPNIGYLNEILRSGLSLFGLNLESGPINIYSWSGLVTLYSLELLPFAYLVISAAFRNLDPALEEAARVTGAGVFRIALTVSVPAVWPAILSSLLLVTMIALAIFSVPIVVGTEAHITVLSVYIVRLINGTIPPRMDEATVLGLMMLLVIGSFWIVQRKMAARSSHATIGGRGVVSTSVPLRRWKWPARCALGLYVLLAPVLPLSALVVVALQPYWSGDINLQNLSFENFETMLNVGTWTFQSLQNSVYLAAVAASIAIMLAAVAVFYGAAAGSRVLNMIDAALKAPSALSSLVLAVGFIVALSGRPFYLGGTAAILLIAYVASHLPHASVAAMAAREQLGTHILEASRVAGGSLGRTFARIGLPLMVPGLAGGWAFVFTLVMGDLTVSALLATAQTPVVGFVVLNIWQTGSYPQLAVLACVMSVLCAAVVLVVTFAAHWYTSRRLSSTAGRRNATEPATQGVAGPDLSRSVR